MSLRDRKRARTRQALVDAAVGLFGRQGYEATTIAEIAAAADVGTRTFFSYFPCKEDLLFPETDRRVRVAVDAIAGRSPDEEPAEVLLRALREANDESEDMTGPLAALRIRLTMEVPAVPWAEPCNSSGRGSGRSPGTSPPPIPTASTR